MVSSATEWPCALVRKWHAGLSVVADQGLQVFVIRVRRYRPVWRAIVKKRSFPQQYSYESTVSLGHDTKSPSPAYAPGGPGYQLVKAPSSRDSRGGHSRGR